MTAWHIAMVRPNQEKRVAAELLKLEFQAVWPRFVELRISRGSQKDRRGRERMETVEVPAFRGYVVFAGSPWQDAHDIDELTRVMRMPGNRDKAYTLPPHIVEQCLGPNLDGVIDDPTTFAQIVHAFVKDQAVAISSGFFTGLRGSVISSTAERVKIRRVDDGREMDVPIRIVSAA